MTRLRAPALEPHAMNDEVAPNAQGRHLYDVAHESTGAIFVALNGGHNDAYLADEERYRDALHQFLTSLSDR